MYVLLLTFVQLVFAHLSIAGWAALATVLNVGTWLIFRRIERGRRVISLLAAIDILALVQLSCVVAYVALLLAPPERRWTGVFCSVVFVISVITAVCISAGLPVRDYGMPLKGRWFRKMLWWLALGGIFTFIPSLVALGVFRPWWLSPLKAREVFMVGGALLSMSVYLTPLTELGLKPKIEDVATVP